MKESNGLIYTQTQVGRMIGRSTKCVYRLINEGKIEYCMFNNRRQIRREALEAFKEELEQCQNRCAALLNKKGKAKP